ncbi:MAG TPA: CoA transferase [Nonomuraea sp.]|nr:CoA transferase [Nonomuraea sp.]
MTGALDGVRVVDFGQFVAGPLAAQILSDHGADVIRVDPPGGPVWGGPANAALQRGKRSIVLDLKDPADRRTAQRLLDTADVAIENFRPGVMTRLGLGADEALRRNPRLVYLSLPGFAADDPRSGMPAYEGVIGAAAGLHQPRDFAPDRPPVFNTLPLCSGMGAFAGLNAVAAALIARERSGWGQHVEVPLFSAALELTRLYGDEVPEKEFPPGKMLGGNADGPLTGHYRCSDGRWVHLSWLEGRQYETFLRREGLYEQWAAEGLLTIERSRFGVDQAFADLLRERLAEALATRPAHEWERRLNPDCDVAPCQTPAEWLLYDEQARAMNAVITLLDPYLGLTHQAGHAVTMSATPPSARGPRRPLDGDREEILAELDTLERPSAPPAPDTPVELATALHGFTAVDVTQLLAGPSACRVLAEYGAEVVQVSNPHARSTRGYHYMTDSGKQTALLDLKKPGALDVFWALIDRADVLSTNYSAEVAARLGVDEASVRQHRPDIVFSRISAHGHLGHRANYRGHEMVGQAVTGMQTRYGNDQAMPMAQPFAINDAGTGQLSAFAMLLALLHRLRTGEGQFVGASLAQTASVWGTPFLVAHRDQDWQQPGGITRLGLGPLQRLYRAADGWFFLAAPGHALDAVARTVELAAGGLQSEEDVERSLEETFATAPAAEWVRRLVAAGLAAHEASSIDAAMEDAWARASGVVQEAVFEGGYHGRLVGAAARLSRTPIQHLPVPPPIGWDTAEMIREVGLGDRLGDLLAAGAAVIAPERTESTLP